MSLSFGRESKALEHMQFLRYYHECSCLHPLKQNKSYTFPIPNSLEIFTIKLLWLQDPSCGWCCLHFNMRSLLESDRPAG